MNSSVSDVVRLEDPGLENVSFSLEEVPESNPVRYSIRVTINDLYKLIGMVPVLVDASTGKEGVRLSVDSQGQISLPIPPVASKQRPSWLLRFREPKNHPPDNEVGIGQKSGNFLP